jgi:hypothetical protein
MAASDSATSRNSGVPSERISQYVPRIPVLPFRAHAEAGSKKYETESAK